MKCPFCNENLPEGSMFCSNCGTRVDNASGSGGAKGGGVNEVPLYQIPEPAPAMMPERKKGGCVCPYGKDAKGKGDCRF